MTTGARRANRPAVRFVAVRLPILAMLAVTRVTVAAPAGGEPGYGGRVDAAEITVVADETCAPRLRDVLAEQLAGLVTKVDWSCRQRFDSEDLFRPASGGRPAVRVWIDVVTVGEARVTLEDDRSERFVVRRIPLPNGMDEVSREEIGNILRFAMIAVLARASETLSRAEARATLSSWPTHTAPGVSSKAPTAGPLALVERGERRKPTATPLFEVGPLWSLQAFSREIPLIQELALSVGLTRQSRPFSVWIEAGYRLPTIYRAEPVGVALGANSVRLGMTLERRGGRRVSWGVGAAGGLNRISFAPSHAVPSFEAAPEGHFLTATGRLLFVVDLRAQAHLAIGLRLFCDVSTSDVHYDIHDVGGGNRRVLSAFGVMPGLSLVIAWRP